MYVPVSPGSQHGQGSWKSRRGMITRATAEPMPSEGKSAAGGAGEGPKTLMERVGDDPVLRQRAQNREAWSPPRPSLGDQIQDVLYIYGGLLDRPFGSGQSLAAAGAVVVERVRAEVNAALPSGAGQAGPAGEQGMPVSSAPIMAATPQEEQKKVQVCFEILRLMQLLSVDLEMMKAAVKEETLLPRLEAAKGKCKSAMALARHL